MDPDQYTKNLDLYSDLWPNLYETNTDPEDHSGSLPADSLVLRRERAIATYSTYEYISSIIVHTVFLDLAPRTLGSSTVIFRS